MYDSDIMVKFVSMTDTLSNNASRNTGPFVSGTMVTIQVTYLSDSLPEIELWSNLNQKDLTEWVATPFHLTADLKGVVGSEEATCIASTTIWIKPVDHPVEYGYTVRGRNNSDEDWVWFSAFHNPADNTMEVVPPLPKKKGWRLSSVWRRNRRMARAGQNTRKA